MPNSNLTTATSESTTLLDKTEIIHAIQQLVPPGSPDPTDPAVLDRLQDLTNQLIRAYQAEGGLQDDPFADVWDRNIHLYEAEVRQRLADKVVLVTGGAGCVGSALIQKIAGLGARRIISVDKALEQPQPVVTYPSIEYYNADIRDYDKLAAIFAQERPQIVFHLAAQRLPWLAEIQIHETVTSNIFGTQNIIRLCEAYGVEQCVYSSTGKASRYFTDEVYAASKKVSEWQLARAAAEGNVTYGMVRFTHMLNNSSFCEYFDKRIAQNQPVKVHAPHRYIVGQNVGEAMHLLLNALVLSQPKKLRFFLCRNLGWPTETLEVALYKICKSGQSIPLWFQGLVAGYEEPFFRGQVDWSNPSELNTLINVIESQTKTIDDSGDMIISEIAPFSTAKLDHHLAALSALTTESNLPGVSIKLGLAEAIKDIAGSTFAQLAPDLLLQMWKWGFDPNYFQRGSSLDAYHQTVMNLFMTGLFRGWYCDDLPAMRKFVQDALAMHPYNV